MRDRVRLWRRPPRKRSADDTSGPSGASSLDGQPERVALVERVKLIPADLARRSVNELLDGLDRVGLEDADAPLAVGAWRDEGQRGSLRQVQRPAPERFRVGD